MPVERPVAFYVHHHGSGHRTRATLIAQRLTSAVIGFGTGPRPAGWPGRWVSLPADDDPPLDEAADPTASGTFHWAPLRHLGHRERLVRLAIALHRTRPTVMVVDVSPEVATFVRLLGTPIGVMAQPGDRGDRAHALAYALADAVFAPWPVGAHAEHAAASRALHLGAMSRFDDLEPRPSSEPKTVTLMLGDGGTEVPRALIEATRAATPDHHWTLCGGPFPRSPDILKDLTRASVVVTHAGENAVAEVAALNRSAVVVALERPFGEQLATTAALRSLGVDTALEAWPPPAAWPALLDRASRHPCRIHDVWPVGGAEIAARAIEAIVAQPTSKARQRR